MKSRPKWASLLVAVVIIAALPVSFAETASAYPAGGGATVPAQSAPTITAGQAGVSIGERAGAVGSSGRADHRRGTVTRRHGLQRPGDHPDGREHRQRTTGHIIHRAAR